MLHPSAASACFCERRGGACVRNTGAVPGHFPWENLEKPCACRGPVMWFRNDLRVHDNGALAAANREGTSLLPVFCFDPREFGGGGGSAAPRGGRRLDTTGPYRAQCDPFLLRAAVPCCFEQSGQSSDGMAPQEGHRVEAG